MLGSTAQHKPTFSSSYSKKERWQVFNQKSTYNSVENIANVRANQYATVQGGSAEGPGLQGLRGKSVFLTWRQQACRPRAGPPGVDWKLTQPSITS